MIKAWWHRYWFYVVMGGLWAAGMVVIGLKDGWS
jgi:hypothetical protein